MVKIKNQKPERKNPKTASKPVSVMRWIGRIVAIGWAGWWSFFGVASFLSEPFSANALIVIIVFCLIFAFSAAIPWFWEPVGSFVLLIEGGLVMIVYPLVTWGHMPFTTIAFVLVTMALPPVIAGVLLLLSWRRSRVIKQ
jgi:hypothetical protein